MLDCLRYAPGRGRKTSDHLSRRLVPAPAMRSGRLRVDCRDRRCRRYGKFFRSAPARLLRHELNCRRRKNCDVCPCCRFGNDRFFSARSASLMSKMKKPSVNGWPSAPPQPGAMRSRPAIILPSATWTWIVQVFSGPGMKEQYSGAVGSVTLSTLQPRCQRWAT